jgi:predicted GIY-YIG superfamily endonuclease
MDVVRTIEHNGELLTVVHDERGLFMPSVQSLEKIGNALLHTCKKLTNTDIDLINKKALLDDSPSMYAQLYGEDDPMWIEYERNYAREPIVKPRRKKIKGHVYFLKCRNTNLYKIGYSSSVKDRIKNIKQGSPTEIDVIGYVASEDCYADEKACHELFSKKRTKGEWFALTNDDINTIEGLLHADEI